MSEYNEGDLVEVTKGETVVRGFLRRGGHPKYLYVGDAGALKELYLAEGWTVTRHEKAAPALPTTPGVYEAPSMPCADGFWPYVLVGRVWSCNGDVVNPQHIAPLTRLEPVPVTVQKVVDYLRKRDSPLAARKVELHFGLTS